MAGMDGNYYAALGMEVARNDGSDYSRAASSSLDSASNSLHNIFTDTNKAFETGQKNISSLNTLLGDADKRTGAYKLADNAVEQENAKNIDIALELQKNKKDYDLNMLISKGIDKYSSNYANNLTLKTTGLESAEELNTLTKDVLAKKANEYGINGLNVEQLEDMFKDRTTYALTRALANTNDDKAKIDRLYNDPEVNNLVNLNLGIQNKANDIKGGKFTDAELLDAAKYIKSDETGLSNLSELQIANKMKSLRRELIGQKDEEANNEYDNRIDKNNRVDRWHKLEDNSKTLGANNNRTNGETRQNGNINRTNVSNISNQEEYIPSEAEEIAQANINKDIEDERMSKNSAIRGETFDENGNITEEGAKELNREGKAISVGQKILVDANSDFQRLKNDYLASEIGANIGLSAYASAKMIGGAIGVAPKIYNTIKEAGIKGLAKAGASKVGGVFNGLKEGATNSWAWGMKQYGNIKNNASNILELGKQFKQLPKEQQVTLSKKFGIVAGATTATAIGTTIYKYIQNSKEPTLAEINENARGDYSEGFFGNIWEKGKAAVGYGYGNGYLNDYLGEMSKWMQTDKQGVAYWQKNEKEFARAMAKYDFTELKRIVREDFADSYGHILGKAIDATKGVITGNEKDLSNSMDWYRQNIKNMIAGSEAIFAGYRDNEQLAREQEYADKDHINYKGIDRDLAANANLREQIMKLDLPPKEKETLLSAIDRKNNSLTIKQNSNYQGQINATMGNDSSELDSKQLIVSGDVASQIVTHLGGSNNYEGIIPKGDKDNKIKSDIEIPNRESIPFAMFGNTILNFKDATTRKEFNILLNDEIMQNIFKSYTLPVTDEDGIFFDAKTKKKRSKYDLDIALIQRLATLINDNKMILRTKHGKPANILKMLKEATSISKAESFIKESGFDTLGDKTTYAAEYTAGPDIKDVIQAMKNIGWRYN